MIDESLIVKRQANSGINVEPRVLYSEYLERDVLIDFYLPFVKERVRKVELLLINDGQDLRTMNFTEIIGPLIKSKSIRKLLCVGIHCSADRMMEYGTSYSADYMGRGAKAGLYAKFIMDELLPYIRKEFKIVAFKEKSFAGFSLGALSALDIVWNNATKFSKAGVFSGSLWWRRRSYEDGYNGEKDRIMHLQVQKGVFKPGLKFFFECGRLDETADRNNNGIIDSIEDTADLIAELRKLGYTDEQICYFELEDGRHDVPTWAKAFPAFLKWGWGRE